MEKVLVTGGAGYIGSVLTGLLLAKGYDVTVYDNLMYQQSSLLSYCEDPKFTFVFGDVTDQNKLKKYVVAADIILPLAAIVGFPAGDRSPKLTVDVNFYQNVFIKDNTSKDQQVIFPTTNSGYGVGINNVYYTEDMPLNPVSHYGKTKVEAEKMWQDTGRAIMLRFATCFGMSLRMRLDLLVNDFTYRALTDGYIVLFEKDYKRNYLHVKDAANTFLFMLENYTTQVGQTFNVGLSTANISKLELAQKIKEVVQDLVIIESEVKQDPDKRNYVISNEKIEKLAGWKPQHSLEDGIVELVKGLPILFNLQDRHFVNS